MTNLHVYVKINGATFDIMDSESYLFEYLPTIEFKINPKFDEPNDSFEKYGEQSNPYKISCLRHFQNIQYSPNASFIQTVEFNFNYSYTTTRQGFIFTGSYNGQNYEIKNVSLSYWTVNPSIENKKCWGGLFSFNRGTIENVKLNINSNVDSAVDYGTPGVVSTVNYVGGIVGYNQGKINNCRVSGTITSYSTGSTSGGIVGYNLKGDILNCWNDITLTSYGNVGGIAGFDFHGYIYNSANNGKINLNIYNNINNSAGGIVGEGWNSTLSATSNYNAIYYIGANSTSKSLAPRMGAFAGTMTNGYWHGSNYSSVFKGTLHSEGNWNQAQYVSEYGQVGKTLEI